MPIYELGYRSWRGRLTPSALRWVPLTRTGVLLAWRSRWLRRLLFLAWMPTLYFGVAFFAYEFLVEEISKHQEVSAWALKFLGTRLPVPQDLLEHVAEDPGGARPRVWRYLLWLFFRSPQAILMILMIGVIAPPLITQDLRTRAFLLYFSRPISRLEYILGKAAIIWVYILLITTAPALALYAGGVLLSPSAVVLKDTWAIPLQILAASAVLIIPTTTLALTISSLTTETRYASFGWFAVWILGWVSYASLKDVNSPWGLVSLFHTLGKVQSWIFGVEPSTSHVLLPAALLIVLTLGSFGLLFHRISAPMRA